MTVNPLVEQQHSVPTIYPFPQCSEVLSVNKHSYTANLEEKPSIWQKICDIATNVFKVVVGLILYWTNPSLFAMGIIVGVIFDDKVAEVIGKIKNIWKAQPLAICFFGGFASFLALPVTLATSSILWAANWGSYMSREAQKFMKT
jgi:hypothetical protein